LQIDTGFLTNSPGGNLILRNGDTKWVDAELRFEVVSEGKSHHVWTLVSVAPGESVLYVQYLAPIESSTISICETSSIGVIDSPDPILSLTPPPSDPGDGGGLPFGY
jgi:hypothetical protein